MVNPNPINNSERSKRKIERGIQVNSPDLSGRIHKRAKKRLGIKCTHAGFNQSSSTLQVGEVYTRNYNSHQCKAGGSIKF